MSQIKKEWCLIELHGQRYLAGHVSEVRSFGTEYLRVDVPRADGSWFVKFYSGKAVFCLTPTTEAGAREYLARATCEPDPRLALTLPPAPPAAPIAAEQVGDHDENPADNIGWDDLDPSLSFAPVNPAPINRKGVKL